MSKSTQVGSTSPPVTNRARGERAFVARLRAELEAGDAGWMVPFGDDGAPLPVNEPGWVWTTDILTSGTDFVPAEHRWRAVGRKAMAVNLSDCAAMGVEPRAALCGLVLDERMTEDDALELVRGVRDGGANFGCALVGGDTNSWPHPTVVSVTVAGRAEAGRRPVLRSGARPGDLVFVSGRLGGSILGRHMTFTPRVALGLEINRRLAPRAMIDISDGLSVDLRHVMEASGCGAELRREWLEAVIHDDARRLGQRDGVPALEHALHDGEDFELVVVLDGAAERGELRLACDGLGLHPIGRMVAGAPRMVMVAEDGAGEEIEPRGWEHFRG